MKVAIINSVYGNGSTGKIVKELEDCLNSNNVKCKVFYGRKLGNESGGEYFGSNLSVKVHALFSRLFGKHGLRSNKATKELIKKLEEFKPDVINLHNIHGYYLNYKILFEYLIKSQVKVFWTLHDLWPITGHCAYFENCDSVNECKNCKGKGEYPKAFIDNAHKNYQIKKSLFSQIEDLTFICPSNWIKEEMQKSFLKDKKFIVINNGIDLNKYHYQESEIKEQYSLQNKKIIIGVAMQWSERKGLSVFNELAKDLPPNYKIALVGVKNEKVSPNVLVLPEIKGYQELIKVYSMGDILINPTLMDNFPTVNIESLACGTPVITYDTGGSKEIIDSSCGIYVEKGNYQELLKAILNFNYEKYNRENCQNRAKIFNKTDKYLEYLALFKGEKC